MVKSISHLYERVAYMYAPIFVTTSVSASLIIATIWSEQNVCAIVLVLDAHMRSACMHLALKQAMRRRERFFHGPRNILRSVRRV